MSQSKDQQKVYSRLVVLRTGLHRVGMFEPRGDEEVNSWLFELKEIPGILWAEWRFELAKN